MRRWRFGLLALLVPFAVLAAAWDTRVIEGDIWRSTYFKEKSKSIPEHSTLADLALTELGVVDQFGVQGSADVTVVDLNASFFREDELASMDREGDDRRTRVEERLIPQPARFAGLPDYSYGPADWLNKNLTCPIGGPPGYTRYCHDFTGWLGSLNSVHFGSQATRMYARYHTLALDRAERARVMRSRMTSEERLIHADALKEAEHQALVYEGYAQHFLQDRWAIGHMWERWDGPDRTQIDDRSMLMSLAIGGVAGFIHGSESATGSADAMSSPLPGQDAARPMEFRHVSRPDLAPVPAVGDERLADMGRGAFGKGYGGPDQPLDVRVQQREMLTCSKAGWAEVIRALGPGDRGGYGTSGARLSADAPEFRVLSEETCWDMWATNRSVYIGFTVEDAIGRASLAALAELRVVPDLSRRGLGESLENIAFRGSDLTALGWRMWRRQLLDPNGTDLARGGIGALWNAQTGDKAGLPIYAEPLDPDALPDQSIGGVDRQTLYGAFSRAHSDHWGGDAAREMLDRLRRSDRDRMWDQRQQTCQFVADMAWQGTHPSYSGRMARRRMADGRPVRSLAHIRLGPREADEDDPADPFYIDQGYVSRTEARDPVPTFGSKPAANWCARVPVVRLSRDPELRDQNVIQVLSADADRVELIGRDFGSQKGRVLIYQDGRGKRTRGRIVDWEHNRIQINFRRGELKPDRDYVVEIRTDDGRRSVGLFILRIRPEEVEEAEMAASSFVGGCDAVPPPVPGFDLRGNVVARLGYDTREISAPAYGRALGGAVRDFRAVQHPLREYMLRERSCILQRKDDGVVSLSRMEREGRQWAVRESDAYFRVINQVRPTSGNWVSHCAATSGGPVQYRVRNPLPVRFSRRGDFWDHYARELDGVIQYMRFAETFGEAWVLALNRSGPPMAPDPTLAQAGYDMRITDPAVLLERYFRPVPGTRSGPEGDGDRHMWKEEAISQAHLWTSSAIWLYENTQRGLVARRDYEDWLVNRVRREARDPLDAYCRAEAALGWNPTMRTTLGVGGDSYTAADGRNYSRIAWPYLDDVEPNTTVKYWETAPLPPVDDLRVADPRAPIPPSPRQSPDRGLPPITPRYVPGSPVGRRRRPPGCRRRRA